MAPRSPLPLWWKVTVVLLVSLLPLLAYFRFPRLTDTVLGDCLPDGFLVIALWGFLRAAVAALARERNFAWVFYVTVIGSSLVWFPTVMPQIARIVSQALGQPT